MNHLFFRFGLLIGLAFLASRSFAQQPVLLLDVNPGILSSYPDDMIKVKQHGYCFFARVGNNFDLCGTDGTSAKTRVIKKFNNIFDGFYPGSLKKIGSGKAIFTVSDSIHGNEVWVTDGTSDGTFMLHDFNPGINGSSAQIGPEINGKVFLKTKRSTDDQYISYWQLWVTDGSVSGTMLLKDSLDYAWFPPIPLSTSAVLNNALIFYMWNHSIGASELWRSDGTVNGTYRLTTSGASDPSFPKMITYNNLVFFGGSDSQHGKELWKTDGTISGTGLLKDLLPGSSDSWPGSFTSFQNDTYFLAYTDILQDRQLWKTDGTTDGTTLADVGRLTSIYSIAGVSGNYLYLDGQKEGSNEQMWRTDGTASGTINVMRNYPKLYPDAGEQFLNINGTAYFTVDNTDYFPKPSLLKSDGTVLGTQDIFGEPLTSEVYDISDLTKVNGSLYFTGETKDDQGIYSYDPVTNKLTDYNFFGHDDEAEILFADDSNIFLSLEGTGVGNEPYVLKTTNSLDKNSVLLVSSNFKVDIYPNPSAGELTVQFLNQNESIDKVSLLVRDMAGNIVLDMTKEMNIGINDFQLQLPKNLPNGLYVVSFITKEGTQQQIISLQR